MTIIKMGNSDKMSKDDLDDATVAGAVNAFGDETSLHGLRYLIGRGHLLFRICWLAIVVLAFGLLVIQAKTVYDDFKSSPYSTRIEIVSEVVKTFPAVTVCNDNKMRRSQLYDTKYKGLVDIDDGDLPESTTESSGRSEDSTGAAWHNVHDEYDWKGFYTASQADDLSDFINVVNPSKDELNDYGHTLEDFVIQCTYNQKTCNLSKDFTVLQNRHYGNCFTFNFGGDANHQTVMTSKTGARYGLHMTLMIDEDEYMGLLAPNRGAKIVIHAPNTMPFPEDDAINLATGSATYIGLREEVIERLPRFSQCSDVESATVFSNSSTNYTVRCCLSMCYQQNLVDRCGCVDDIVFDYKQCSVINDTEMACVSEVQALYINDDLHCNCPLPCQETNYRASISSADWPSERFRSHLVRKFEFDPKLRSILAQEEMSAKNMIRVMIYFETLNVERVEQVPRYTIPNILGNIGGLMGLFTGMSFISLFEVAFLLLRISKITFTKLFMANRVKSIAT
ncbi:amiloride-sensitive sodium channel subunit beta-like [Lytechinus variegatus]|uniref:amiloride-sensitive sodium channel subunit beta-like n=1 Tax=Lytechinus variegatus TaxID=7654 RepID=UPI001BB2874C|nr:amiloride-sensitive sodium channel subunit beta-like [Lytechinus variegatus]